MSSVNDMPVCINSLNENLPPGLPGDLIFERSIPIARRYPWCETDFFFIHCKCKYCVMEVCTTLSDICNFQVAWTGETPVFTIYAYLQYMQITLLIALGFVCIQTKAVALGQMFMLLLFRQHTWLHIARRLLAVCIPIIYGRWGTWDYNVWSIYHTFCIVKIQY